MSLRGFDITRDYLRLQEASLTVSNLSFQDALLLFVERNEALQGDEYHDERERLLVLATLYEDEDLRAALQDSGTRYG